MGSQIFPETPKPVFEYNVSQGFNTGISSFRGGNEQFRIFQSYPRYSYNLLYDQLSNSELNILWNFYRNHYGAGDTFWYWDQKSKLEEMSFEELYIGIGDSVISVFDIPGKIGPSDSITVRVNDIQQVRDTDYTVLIGGGSGGADRISFTSAPATLLIECDFIGQLRVKSRFAVDDMDYSWFAAMLHNTGLELRGVLPNA